MKKLLFISLLLPCFCFGQSYHSLVDTNKVWSIIEHTEGWVDTVWVDAWDTYFLKFNEDTTIGTYQYKKLIKSNDSLQVIWTDFGYIREDTNKRVYARLNDTSEVLIYDFSLNTGDSTIIYEYGWGYPNTYDCPMEVKVDSVDSVTLLNGEVRKRWFTNIQFTLPGQVVWIEGIGGANGLLIHDYCFVGDILTRELLCFAENDTLKYQHPSYNNCYYSTVGIKENQKKHLLKAYPNPTSGKFTVQGATAEIQIFDLFGRLVLRSNKPEIDMSSYPASIYMIKVGEAVRKLIKQ